MLRYRSFKYLTLFLGSKARIIVTRALEPATEDTRIMNSGGRMDGLDGKIDRISWMLGANICLCSLIMGKLLLLH